MKTYYALGLALLMAAAATVPSHADEPQLKLTPTGRILMDGALYASPEKEMFKDGVAIPDVRMGVKASYGSWNAKIDISYANQKVGIKDLFIQYNYNKEVFFRFGNFIHQYGLQSATSSSMKPSFEEPLSNSVFNAARQIGIMAVYNGPKFLTTFSVHAEPSSINNSPNALNHQGYGLITRLVARPVVTDDGTVVQVGISGAFTTPQTEGEDMPHQGFSMAGNFPSRVDKVVAASVDLTHAMNMWKFTPELLLAKGPVALEAQYFFNRVNMRHNLHNFTGQGGYVTLRGLLKGDHYTYSPVDGGLATPRPKSLEFVALYNYTSLSDPKAEYIADDGTVLTGIYGGRVNTLSATLNYYINKYILMRVNYAYTYRWNSSDLPRVNLNVFQIRLQVLF
ncbi:MAG: ATPase [Bacteroidales bacterium]|nr:ATPase [Bacteroidales bacterium]